MLIDWKRADGRLTVFVTDELEPPLTLCAVADGDGVEAALEAVQVATLRLRNRRKGIPQLGDRMRIGSPELGLEGKVCYVDRHAQLLRLDTLKDQLLNWGLCSFVDHPAVHWNRDGRVGPDVCRACNRELP